MSLHDENIPYKNQDTHDVDRQYRKGGTMLSVIGSCSTKGVEGYLVQVEVDVSSGLPGFYICGLPDAAVKEAKDRVRAAIKNSGYKFPLQRITVNLAPADIKKEGSHFDLPIALGILAATEQAPIEALMNTYFVGELSLKGDLRKANGILPMALSLKENAGDSTLVVPRDNGPEASLVQDLKIIPTQSLGELVRFFKGEEDLKSEDGALNLEKYFSDHAAGSVPDMIDVKGQEGAKRALEIAAAGGHNILMMGSPGSGKTMLARRLPGILPPMAMEEIFESTKIYSVAGILDYDTPLVVERPFRAPHHTASAASIIGGGQIPKPGEVSLSNNGVLFLDEFPEFRRDVIEALRQPLEEKNITIARAAATLTFPANFIFAAAMNPCPCGFLNDEKTECLCTPFQIQRYKNKISGPILDRIDIHIHVPRLNYTDISESRTGENSATIKKRVLHARE
ncbi:MAG: YifB family Mg chelatase-like AAA ATPase, partial [Clostridia bacterium]|nr:YifB family Mg chelatase-like AAA ATPase [Clostridia bacterium]